MDNLEEFLKGSETIDAEDHDDPVAEATPAEPDQSDDSAPEPKAERPRGPDGKFIPKGEAPETPAEAASPAAPEPQIDHAALIGERRRRQEAEAELVQLRQQLQQAPQPPQFQAPTQAPDMFEDPEGYTRYVAAQAAEVARHEAYGQFQYQRIDTAARQFAPTVPDYAEKVQVFQQMAQANPALLQELFRANNPAEYAYNTAKTQLEISQFGGIEGLIKARVEDALKANAPTATTPPVPDTLADAQSSRGSSAEPFSPPTLDQILGRAA
jgi:hypothetical protein